MSAPLRLTAGEMRELADALDALTKVRRNHRVSIAGYGTYEVRHVDADVVLALSWNEDEGYLIDDRSGA